MKISRPLIKDIFENYGHIILDTVEPTRNLRWLKNHFIKQEMEGKGTGGGGFDEYRYTGPSSMLLLMVKKFWYEDEEFFEEYFERDRP